MSEDVEKFKHSRRRLKDENAMNKQVKIAKSHGAQIEEPHRYAKHHAMDCGNPSCILCGNPRKIFHEKTIQEKRFEQKNLWNDE